MVAKTRAECYYNIATCFFETSLVVYMILSVVVHRADFFVFIALNLIERKLL